MNQGIFPHLLYKVLFYMFFCSKKVKINYKIKNEYKNAQELPQAITNKYKNELLKKDLEKESIEEGFNIAIFMGFKTDFTR